MIARKVSYLFCFLIYLTTVAGNPVPGFGKNVITPAHTSLLKSVVTPFRNADCDDNPQNGDPVPPTPEPIQFVPWPLSPVPSETPFVPQLQPSPPQLSPFPASPVDFQYPVEPPHTPVHHGPVPSSPEQENCPPAAIFVHYPNEPPYAPFHQVPVTSPNGQEFVPPSGVFVQAPPKLDPFELPTSHLPHAPITAPVFAKPHPAPEELPFPSKPIYDSPSKFPSPLTGVRPAPFFPQAPVNSFQPLPSDVPIQFFPGFNSEHCAPTFDQLPGAAPVGEPENEEPETEAQHPPTHGPHGQPDPIYSHFPPPTHGPHGQPDPIYSHFPERPSPPPSLPSKNKVISSTPQSVPHPPSHTVVQGFVPELLHVPPPAPVSPLDLPTPLCEPIPAPAPTACPESDVNFPSPTPHSVSHVVQPDPPFTRFARKKAPVKDQQQISQLKPKSKTVTGANHLQSHHPPLPTFQKY